MGTGSQTKFNRARFNLAKGHLKKILKQNSGSKHLLYPNEAGNRV